MEISHYNDGMCIVKDFLGTQSRNTICTAFAFGAGHTEKEAVGNFLKELRRMRDNLYCAINEADEYLKGNSNARENNDATEEDDRA